MEIRGLGIIDVQSVFGIRSIRLQKRVEVEVNLREWSNEEDYERVGLDGPHPGRPSPRPSPRKGGIRRSTRARHSR